VQLGTPSRIYPVGTDRGLPGKMVFGLAPPACMLQALLSQIKAVGPSQSGGKAQIMGQKRKSEKSFGFCDHQMTSTTTKDVSNRRHDCCLSSFSVSDSTLHKCKYSLRSASQCIAQPNTALLDCIVYLVQRLYDPGILPSSAN